jgi:pimeloyl-ACP methyl ester carboxylesterase
MGGTLGTRFALMFPDRTDRLVLVNPIGLEDWKTVVPYLTVDQFFAGELRQTPESIREYEGLVRHRATPFVRTLPAMISAASPLGIGVQAESLRKGRSARPLPADS